MKQCKVCGETKELTEFYKHPTSKGGRRNYCKACSNNKGATWRASRSEEQVARDRAATVKSQKDGSTNLLKFKARKVLVESLGGKCEKCGYDKCIAALDFHHKDPTEKDFNISKVYPSKNMMPKLLEEVSKCMLLCANCHREEHNLDREADYLKKL